MLEQVAHGFSLGVHPNLSSSKPILPLPGAEDQAS
jgi:hypothetical protein